MENTHDSNSTDTTAEPLEKLPEGEFSEEAVGDSKEIRDEAANTAHSDFSMITEGRAAAQTALKLARQLVLSINNHASWSYSTIDGAMPEISRPMALFLVAKETVWQGQAGLGSFGQSTAWGFRAAARQVSAVIPARQEERGRLLEAAVTEIISLQTNTKRVPNEERGAFWLVFAGHHVAWPESVKANFLPTDKMGEAVVAEAIRIAVDEQVLADDLDRLLRGDQTNKGATTVVAFERSRPQ
jgi:hypothetical protein